MEEDLEVLGINVPELPKADLNFAVWPENWESVELFCRLSTQWIVGGMGQFLGISYPAIESLFRLARVDPEDHAELFANIQIMEQAALETINERNHG